MTAVSLIAAEENSRPLVECPKASSAIKVDGDLSDAAWQESPVLTPFVTLHGDAYPKAQTEVRVLWEKDTLFLGIKVFESQMADVKTEKLERDSGVWEDDCIEIFLKPSDGDWHQFIVNSKGVQEDHKSENMGWNGKWESGAGKFDGGWTLEAGIPLGEIGAKGGVGAKIAFNICRERYAQAELSAYANPAGNFRNTAQYGQLLFVEKPQIWWQAQVPEEVMSESSAIVLHARGPNANYDATVVAYAAGNEKTRQTKPFRCVVGELHKVSMGFQVPGTKKPSVQLTLKDKNGKCILQTERLPLKVGDARKYELLRAKELLGKIQKDKLPPRFAGCYPEWAERLRALEKEPSVAALRDLSRCIGIAGLVATLSSNQQGRPAITGQADAPAIAFVVPPFTFTDYEQVPQPQEVGGTIQIAACKDEYEPGALNVLALEDLKEVTIQIGELKSPQASLPAAAFDVRLVKNWYQAGEDSMIGAPVFVPELLVKDDSWCQPDHEKKNNVFKFPRPKALSLPDWPGPDDPAGLQPVAIPAFTNRQFWILLHVPKDQDPGEYRGTVKVMNEGKELLNTSMVVQVLPVTLEPTDAVFGMFNHYLHSMGKDAKADEFYEKTLEMCRRYGMNSLQIMEHGAVNRLNGKMEVDVSPVRKALELRKKHGLTAHTLIASLHWLSGRMDTIWTMAPETIRDDSNEVVQEFLAFCKEVKKVANEIGIEISIYTYDEPGYDQTGKNMARCRAQDDRVREAGLKCSAAITLDGARKLGANLDVPILSGESLSVGVRKSVHEIPYACYYYHPLELPVHDRVQTGLMIWYNRLNGAMPYVLADNGWDDWIGYGTHNYRPERYIYDGANGPIPTIQLEGFREGVDDYKYLEMIARRCERIRKGRLADQQAKLLAEAEAVLNHPPAALSGIVAQINQKATAADFKVFREQCQGLLVRLEKVSRVAQEPKQGKKL